MIMLNREQQLLHAMGIQSWELTHPERLQGYQPTKVTLDNECTLLLVCPNFPAANEIALFEKVLKSFNVKLEQAQHVLPNNLANIDLSPVEWVWFSGCESQTFSGVKTLTSPLLSEVEGHTQHRRDLWQQICSYTKD